MGLKHLSKNQIITYLDGGLSQPESRAVWQHLHGCSQCHALLQNEQRVRSEVRLELGSLARRDDLKLMLPGILAEVRRPPRVGFNKMTLLLALGMVMLMMLPMLPLLRTASIMAMDGDLFNVPATTQSITLPEKQETQVARSEIATLHNTFNVEYASPAPLPQVTVIAKP